METKAATIEQEKCGHCAHFREDGKCSHYLVSNIERGYFDKACSRFERPGEVKPVEVKGLSAFRPLVCKNCGRSFPLEGFARNRYGYTRICKECRSAQMSRAYSLRKDRKH